MSNKIPTPKNMFILVEVPKVQKETDSGIVLPDQKVNKEQGIGIVKAISQNCINTIQDVVKVGDKIAYNPFEALPYSENGSNYVFIEHKDIIAIINA